MSRPHHRCAPLADTCEAYVEATANPEAYWVINYLDVYERNGTNATRT